MLDLNYTLTRNYDMEVDAAYIITLPNNDISTKFTNRCIQSCESVNQPYKLWEGFNGNTGKIITPVQHQSKDYLNWIKLYHDKLTPTQIGCWLSHFSLWCHCISIQKPIVILEHDSIMVKPYTEHRLFNSIVYLGAYEQAMGKAPIYATPIHASSMTTLVRSICRAHAYAIDTAVAKNLVSHAIKYGITESLDIWIRADIFPIAQFPELYAYDDNQGLSTIHKEWERESH